MTIAILGEALIDFKSTGKLAFQGFIGGSSLNVATAGIRLGQATIFLTQISNDIFGNALMDHLQHENVNTNFILRSAASSTLAFVEEKAGQAHFSFVGKGAADTLYDPQPRPVLPFGTRFIQFGSISLLTEPTASSILEIVASHRERVTVVLDPNCRPQLTPDVNAYRTQLKTWLKVAHLVKVSDQDLAWLEPEKTLEDVARQWLEYGVFIVIITCGEHGCVLYRAGHAPISAETPKINVIDTVGAGDTFTAALMVALLEYGHTSSGQLSTHTDETLREVLRFAAASAAINCTRAGCDPPTRSEVTAFQNNT